MLHTQRYEIVNNRQNLNTVEYNNLSQFWSEIKQIITLQSLSEDRKIVTIIVLFNTNSIDVLEEMSTVELDY